MTEALRTARLDAAGRVLTRDALTALFAAGLTVGLGAANGGYFPTSWGWTGLVVGWAALVALVLGRDTTVTALGAAFLCAGAAFVGWVALSALWSVDVPQTMLEIERDAVYVVAAVGLLLVRRERLAALLGGWLAGLVLVCGYALLTRLLPDRLGVYDSVAIYRLSEPVGYWNALGLLAVLGALLAIGLVARSAGAGGRGLAGASLVVFLACLEFTFSRGAWLALGIGCVVAVALDRRRLQLLAALVVAGVAPAAAVAVCSHAKALTFQGTPLQQAAHEGHRVALELLALAALGALACVGFGVAAERWAPGERTRRVAWGAIGAAALAAVATVVVAYGAPWTIASRSWDAFSAPPVNPTNLNSRLFKLSSNGRLDLWRAALDEARAHPVLGGGAGSYEQWWLRHRPTDMKVRDAHGLYLEVLGELGPIGLLLLGAFLATPLLAIRRAREHPLAAVVAAGYVAYLVEAGVDWQWEMPLVTLSAVALGAVLIGWAGGRRTPQLRAVALPAVAVGLVVAFGGLVGNVEVSRATSALQDGDWAATVQHADRARTWAPWSGEPLRLLGEARLARGDFADARSAFRDAIRRDSRDWELWLDLARSSTGATQRQALAHATMLDPLAPELAEFRRELAEGWVLTDEIQA
jgi:hypothetical protein